MREILFRGKRIDNGEWVHGDLVHAENKSYISYYYESPLSTFINEQIEYVDMSMVGVAPFIEVDLTTIGQYTGLTGKNGKKVFEGDILQVKQHGETGVRTCAIYFGEYIDADSVFKDCRCIGTYLKVVDECCSIGALLDSDFEFEIIGNIHDNPELLEVDK